MTNCPNCGTQYKEIVDCANHMRNQHRYSVEECKEFVRQRIVKDYQEWEESNVSQR